jgi:biotin carboxylase
MSANQTAVLVGASPYGSQALERLGIPYVLVVEHGEDPSRAAGRPLVVLEAAYATDLTSVCRALGQIGQVTRAGLAGVFSFTEDGLLPAALAAEAYGLATTSAASVARTRDKLAMRRALDGRVPQPAWGHASPDTLHEIVYPAILKPVDGAGSESVQRVESPDDAAAIVRRRGAWIWESYLHGLEVSVETVTFNGAHRVLGVTEKWIEPPHYVEVQALAQYYSPARDTRVCEIVARCLDALGVTCGAAHTELRLVDGEPFIVETHTRPGGDRIPWITELTTGLDQYELAIRSVLRMRMPEPLVPRYCAAASAFFPWPTGRIERIDGLDAAQGLPWVEEIVLKVGPGGTVAPRTSNASRPGWAVIGGDSREQVLGRIAELQALVTPHYAAPPTSDGATPLAVGNRELAGSPHR